MGVSSSPYVDSISEDVGVISDAGPGCDVSGLGFDPNMQMCFSLQIPRWFYISKYTTYGYCGTGTYTYQTATLSYELDCQVPTIRNPTSSDGRWYYSMSFSPGINSTAKTIADHFGPVEPGIFILIGAASARQPFTQMQLCWQHDRADRGCYFPGGGLSVGYGR
jgi:hypothetical protein